MLKKRYNPDIMWISDDVLTINKRWTHEFVREVIARNAQHPYECLSRVDLVNREILTGLRETGCFRVWYGAESGSQKVLESMRKGTTVDQVREAARITQELGMQAGFFILLGYPDETTSDIRETITFLKENSTNASRIGLFQTRTGHRETKTNCSSRESFHACTIGLQPDGSLKK